MHPAPDTDPCDEGMRPPWRAGMPLRAAARVRAALAGRMKRLAAAVPGQCAVCHADACGRVCPTCIERFAPPVPRCRRCALPVAGATDRCGDCVLRPPPFDAAVAGVDYGHPWDRLILAFKFHGALDLCNALAQRLQAAVQQAGQPPPDWVLPVPSAPRRLRERGFNPAWEIARRVAPPGSRTDPSLLLRMQDGPHQLALPRDRREANVRGAFAVEPRRRAALAGRRVALVDDVATTGATAGVAATALKAAGAAEVQLWVVARARRPSDAA